MAYLAALEASDIVGGARAIVVGLGNVASGSSPVPSLHAGPVKVHWYWNIGHSPWGIGQVDGALRGTSSLSLFVKELSLP